MLFYNTVTSQALELLKKLLLVQEFKTLRLAGGTSLALQIGHRQSLDLDLFGSFELDELEITKILSRVGNITLLKKTQNINIYLINGIKVDFVNYHYPWLEEAICKDNLRLAGKKDIAAMKLAAITGRGSKKDFIDIYYLLNYFDFPQMLNFYILKYPGSSETLTLKSLTYFDDADIEESPVMLNLTDWEKIKKTIIANISDYLNQPNTL